MGQKINPIIFRKSLSITENSKWMGSKKKLFDLQQQDLQTKSFLTFLLERQGILLRTCKLSKSSEKLQVDLDLFFSHVLGRQAKASWAKSIFKTVKKKYTNLNKIKDLKNFLANMQSLKTLTKSQKLCLFRYKLLNTWRKKSLLVLKKRKRKKYSINFWKKGYNLKKEEKIVSSKAKKVGYRRRFLYFLLSKKEKKVKSIKNGELSILSSSKNYVESYMLLYRYSRFHRLFASKKLFYNFGLYNFRSINKIRCKRAKVTYGRLKSSRSFEKKKKHKSIKSVFNKQKKLDKKNHVLDLFKKILCSLHTFTSCEKIKLRLYSSQLDHLTTLKRYRKSLDEKLSFFARNKEFKSYVFESTETFYFVLSTFGFGNASLLGKHISYLLENSRKHTLIMRFLKKYVFTFFNDFPQQIRAVDGIKILVKGRFNKRRRTKTISVQQGQVFLQTLSAPLDYCQTQAITLYGTFGIKVWLAKVKTLNGQVASRKTLG